MYKTYLGFFDNGLDIVLILVVLISAVYSGGSSLRVVIGLLSCQEVAFHGLDIEFVLGQLFGLLLPLPLFAFSLRPCPFLLCLGLVLLPPIFGRVELPLLHQCGLEFGDGRFAKFMDQIQNVGMFRLGLHGATQLGLIVIHYISYIERRMITYYERVHPVAP